MTRIKKRRSGKKRTADKKKAATGRRGARAIKKEVEKKDKKPLPVSSEQAAAPGNKTATTSGKTRSAGARRVAFSKIVASNKTAGGKKATEGSKRPAAASKKTGKGYAPWNKNRRNKQAPEE